MHVRRSMIFGGAAIILVANIFNLMQLQQRRSTLAIVEPDQLLLTALAILVTTVTLAVLAYDKGRTR